MDRLARQILLIVLPLMLTACGGGEGVLLMAGTTLASYSLTGKSTFDNAMSAAADKDCDIGKMRQNDGKYCVANKIKDDPVFAHVDNPSVYCFRTMGEVECHCGADPYGNNDTPFVKGRGEIAGQSCNMRQQASLPTEPGYLTPSSLKSGEDLPPPSLPPAAYNNILEPAVTPPPANMPFGKSTAPKKQTKPIELAPENMGS